MLQAQIISAVDLHVGGEPIRVVTGGFPRIEGSTMAKKNEYCRQSLDHLRTALVWEPRGHSDMMVTLLTEPVSPGAAYGILYLHGGGYASLSGHSTIGTAAAVAGLGLGRVAPPGGTMAFDTVAGRVEAKVAFERGRVTTVTLRMAPSFVYRDPVMLDVEDFGEIPAAIAYGGAYFALVEAEDVGFELVPGNVPSFIDLGLDVREAANRLVRLQQPGTREPAKVDLVEFYSPPGNLVADARNVVVFGNGSVDRSACGTGTCAKMALLHARGELGLRQPYVHESIVGTRMTGRLVEEVEIGGIRAVVPEISAEAYLTGIHQFVIDPEDPLRHGFTLR
ncbi:MAG: proline racemase family protein [Chloroflexi bacterium]|nr:proline racemase family protein [Chloroflexota bacterium]